MVRQDGSFEVNPLPSPQAAPTDSADPGDPAPDPAPDPDSAGAGGGNAGTKRRAAVELFPEAPLVKIRASRFDASRLKGRPLF